MSMKIEHEWVGGRIDNMIGRGGAAGVNRAAHELRALSVPLAPLDRGPLRASATVREANPAAAAKPEALLIFDTPYAAVQHERLDYHHEDGQAKYVEQPLNENRARLAAMIAQEIRHELDS